MSQSKSATLTCGLATVLPNPTPRTIVNVIRPGECELVPWHLRRSVRQADTTNAQTRSEARICTGAHTNSLQCAYPVSWQVHPDGAHLPTSEALPTGLTLEVKRLKPRPDPSKLSPTDPLATEYTAPLEQPLLERGYSNDRDRWQRLSETVCSSC